MHARLLLQLGDLKRRARAATGRGLFSGISLMVRLSLELLMDAPSHTLYSLGCYGRAATGCGLFSGISLVVRLSLELPLAASQGCL